jgi:hypothetical protein
MSYLDDESEGYRVEFLHLIFMTISPINSIHASLKILLFIVCLIALTFLPSAVPLYK